MRLGLAQELLLLLLLLRYLVSLASTIGIHEIAKGLGWIQFAWLEMMVAVVGECSRMLIMVIIPRSREPLAPRSANSHHRASLESERGPVIIYNSLSAPISAA